MESYKIAEACKMAKNMKRNIVHITPNYMLGTDAEFCTLSMIQTESIIPRNFTYMDKLLDDKLLANPNVQQYRYQLLADGFYIDTWDEPVFENRIMDLFREIGPILNGAVEPVIDRADFTEDAIFRSIVSAKSAEGHNWLALPFKATSILYTSCFSQLHPINTADKIYISVYDYGNDSTVLVKMDIVKKKCTVNEFVRFRLL